MTASVHPFPQGGRRPQARTVRRPCVDCGNDFDVTRVKLPFRLKSANPVETPDGGGWVDLPPGQTRCATCRDSWERREGLRGAQQDHHARREQQAAEAAAQRAAAERWERAIPAPHRGASWDRFAAMHPRQAAALEAWHLHPDSVLLYSAANQQQGNGKSSAAACLVRRLLEHDPDASPVWHTAPIALDKLRRQGSAAADRLLDELCEAPVLVLDDIGRGKPSVWVLDKLFVVVQSRIDHGLTTVITCNYTLSELDEWWRLGAREEPALMKTTSATVVSRLRQLCRLVPFGGSDQRVNATLPTPTQGRDHD